MSKPIFICVPGGSCSPEYYGPIRKGLTSRGYSSVTVDLPSVGAKPAKYDFTEDVQAIRESATKLVEAGEETIVVLHSYAGLPGGNALKGLGKLEREKQGLKGGVIRLVYIMSWIVPEGFQGLERGDTSKMMPFQMIDLEAGTSTPNPKMTPQYFYNDLPLDQQEYWTSKLQPISLGVFWSKSSYAAWRVIPTTAVLCENDKTLPLQMAEYMLAAAQADKPNMIDTVERNETAGHFVMLSQPDWTVDMLRRAAGEKTVE